MDLTSEDLEKKFKCENFADISKCFITMYQSLSKVNKNVCDLNTRVSDVEKEVEMVDNELTNIREADIPTIRKELEQMKLEQLWSN